MAEHHRDSSPQGGRWRGLGAVAAALGAALLAAGAAIAEERTGRIVAIGDIHGDFAAFEAVMGRAGLMNEAGEWTGGDAVLVQNGDIVGRGPDSRRIMRRFMALQSEAEAAGGQVIVLIGNHEAMQMTGDVRYVHPGEWEGFVDEQSEARRAAYFETNRDAVVAAYRESEPDLTDEAVRARFEERVPLGYVEHREAWAPDGELGAWVGGNPAMVVLDDTLFVHGGLSIAYAGFSMEQINAAAQAALTAQTRDRTAIVNDPLGPAWYRGLLREADADPIHMGAHGAVGVEDEIAAILEAFGAERIVVGHTPQRDGVAALHDDQVIVIDTGMTASLGGINAFLEITPDGVFADNDGVRVSIEVFED